MKLLAGLSSFVFVVQVYGQGYGGRTTVIETPFVPILPATIIPKQVMPIPIDTSNGVILSELQRGRFGEDPGWLRRITGSTVDGLHALGGEGAFVIHGGIGGGNNFANGLRDGQGANQFIDPHETVSSWTDALQDPMDFAGGDMLLDPFSGHYLHNAEQSTSAVDGMMKSSAIHAIAGESYNLAKPGIDVNINVADSMNHERVSHSINIGGIQNPILQQLEQMGPIIQNMKKQTEQIGAVNTIPSLPGLRSAGYVSRDIKEDIMHPAANMVVDTVLHTSGLVTQTGNLEHKTIKRMPLSMRNMNRFDLMENRRGSFGAWINRLIRSTVDGVQGAFVTSGEAGVVETFSNGLRDPLGEVNSTGAHEPIRSWEPHHGGIPSDTVAHDSPFVNNHVHNVNKEVRF